MYEREEKVMSTLRKVIQAQKQAYNQYLRHTRLLAEIKPCPRVGEQQCSSTVWKAACIHTRLTDCSISRRCGHQLTEDRFPIDCVANGSLLLEHSCTSS